MRSASALFVFVLLFSVAQGQVLSTDEKIEMLGLAGQSTEIINVVAAADYTLPELEQANELKKLGVNDKNIILVLKAHAKLTYDEILKLKEYQTKGYAESIVQKSVEEKPKFGETKMQKEVEKVNNENKEQQENGDNSSVCDKARDDARYNFDKGFSTTFVPSMFCFPIGGIVYAVSSSKEIQDKDLNVPDRRMMDNMQYKKCYREEAKRIKNNKLAIGFISGFVVNAAIVGGILIIANNAVNAK